MWELGQNTKIKMRSSHQNASPMGRKMGLTIIVEKNKVLGAQRRHYVVFEFSSMMKTDAHL